jgi:hypothetical protein
MSHTVDERAYASMSEAMRPVLSTLSQYVGGRPRHVNAAVALLHQVECNRVTKPTASLRNKFKKLCAAVVGRSEEDVIGKLNTALRQKYIEELTDDAEENIDDLAPAERVDEAVRRMIAVQAAFRSHDISERVLSFITEAAVTADHENGGSKQLCQCEKCVKGRPTPTPEPDSDDD